MADWLLRFGSLKPSRIRPSLLTWPRVAAVTAAGPQIIGTKLTPAGAVIPAGPDDQL